jgi:cytochrome b pre-mRNA-processing protein 3
VGWLGVFGWGRKRRFERVGFLLYGKVVAAARRPFLFAACGVPDTLDGRFDAIALFAALLVRRLRHDVPPGPDLAQALFDAMFSDMDLNLREIGVGDLSVGKKVRAMWEAFHGRALAYEEALDAGDEAALAEALARNVWRGAPAPGAPALARLALASAKALDRQSLAAFARGEVDFPDPPLPPPALPPRAETQS